MGRRRTWTYFVVPFSLVYVFLFQDKLFWSHTVCRNRFISLWSFCNNCFPTNYQLLFSMWPSQHPSNIYMACAILSTRASTLDCKAIIRSDHYLAQFSVELLDWYIVIYLTLIIFPLVSTDSKSWTKMKCWVVLLTEHVTWAWDYSGGIICVVARVLPFFSLLSKGSFPCAQVRRTYWVSQVDQMSELKGWSSS